MPFYLRTEYTPPCRLNQAEAAAEFLLPTNIIGQYVARTFDLAWGVVSGDIMPIILHPGLHYPDLRPATPREIAEYKNIRKK